MDGPSGPPSVGQDIPLAPRASVPGRGGESCLGGLAIGEAIRDARPSIPCTTKGRGAT